MSAWSVDKRDAGLDGGRVMTPLLPTLTGGFGAWALLGFKIVAALGFVTAANLVILYAS